MPSSSMTETQELHLDDIVGMVTFLVPKHVSSTPPLDKDSLFLKVLRSPGITWRGLAPLSLEAPDHVTCRFIRVLLQNTTDWRSKLAERPTSASCLEGTEKVERGGKANDNDSADGFHKRILHISGIPSMTIILDPPTVTYTDSTFTSIVLRAELSLLRLQTLTAWWSTLGGGFFFCRHLQASLQLARQQRAVATQIGNTHMARQCSINEAYNLIYAGKFGSAKILLKDLEAAIHASLDEDRVTLRQCKAARLFAVRLKQVAKGGLRRYYPKESGMNHTVDDFQRIRIVSAS